MGEILWPPTSAHHARRRFLRARSHFELAVGKPRRIGTALDLSVVFAVPARRTVARPTVALLLARCHFSGVRCRRGNLMLDSVQNLQVCGSRTLFHELFSPQCLWKPVVPGLQFRRGCLCAGELTALW